MMKTRDIHVGAVGRKLGGEVRLGGKRKKKKKKEKMRPGFILILHRALKIPSEFP